ncbi:MAG: hypothetical protein GY813_11360, partial [Halieaceae bacterium]|nr:hypothetical protein [Halieaceae bacterium]
MSDQVTYLTPGFFVSFSRRQQRNIFPQLTLDHFRATPTRLALVDALNKGFEGDIEELIKRIHRQFNRPPRVIREFFDTLDKAGYITDTLPELRYAGEPSGALGVASEGEVTIANPAILVTQSGHYLWYDHEGSLLLRLELAELVAAATFSEAITISSAKQQYLAKDDAEIDANQFDDLVSRRAGAGLFSEPFTIEDTDETSLFGTVDRTTLQSAIDARIAAHDDNVADEGKGLVQVIPVNTVHGTTPASLGILMAYAIEYEGGQLRDKYNFVP